MMKKLFAKKSALNKKNNSDTAKINALPENLFEKALEQHQMGNLAQADALYRQILAQNPHHADALHFLGVLAYQVGQYQPAIELMKQAIQVEPNAAAVHCNLGLALQAFGQRDAAIASYQKALVLQPDYVDAHYNLANAFQAQNQHEQAVTHYQQAIALNPDYIGAYCNLAASFKTQSRLDEAVEKLQQAISVNPHHAEIYNNLGLILQAQRCYEDALTAYQQALSLKPDYPEAQCSLADLLLLLGRLREGWQYYEARYHPQLKNRPTVPPNLNFPQWQGELLQGKSLLILPEQGFGDEIQFCRYVSVLKERGVASITIVCKKPLQSLLKTLKGVDQVLTKEQMSNVQPHDYWVFVMSLPHYCQTTLESIPAQVPYFYPDSQRRQQFSAQLSQVKKLKIGICWKGSVLFPQEAERSPGISWFKPLVNLTGVMFFTLQPGTRDEFLSFAGENGFDIGRELEESSFEDAAALISNLDLVITSCTSICHLAGALGKPVWVVLSFNADWRWFLEREDSPWYPTMRLFRQTQRGNWQELFEGVEKRLQKIIAGELSIS